MIGAEWIRSPLPDDWKVARLRDWADLVNGFPFDSRLFDPSEGMPLIRIRDIARSETEVRYLGEPIEDVAIEAGDILIGMDGDFNVSMWRGPRALLNQRVCCLRPKPGISRHFLYYTLAEPLKLINEFTYSTTVRHLSSFDVLKIQIPFPEFSVQLAIADYLDRETARLDALVAAKERLLALLAEKRRALVTRAVTRGLDPNVPMRDSGVPWLGEVPAHWEVCALRFLVSFSGGGTPDTSRPELWDGQIPWVSPKDMKRPEIADAEDHVSPAALEASPLKIIEPGAVLIVVRGMILAHSFPAALAVRPVTINQDMKALRCDERLLPSFLRDFFRGHETHVVSLADSSAHGTRKLETESLGRFEVLVPPLEEQQELVSHLAEATERLDSLRAATERSLSLLKERRAAVISAAVTGRMVVPGGLGAGAEGVS